MMRCANRQGNVGTFRICILFRVFVCLYYDIYYFGKSKPLWCLIASTLTIKQLTLGSCIITDCLVLMLYRVCESDLWVEFASSTPRNSLTQHNYTTTYNLQ